jgi:hypothetical protein
MSNDKPLPITLTGIYKGYQVAVQVETTLDKLDALVNRLQARGIEPLPAPAAGGNGKAAKELQEFRGQVNRPWHPERGPKVKFALVNDDQASIGCDIWDSTLAGEFARQQIQEGDTLVVQGTLKTRESGGKVYKNFAVETFQKIAQQQAA